MTVSRDLWPPFPRKQSAKQTQQKMGENSERFSVQNSGRKKKKRSSGTFRSAPLSGLTNFPRAKSFANRFLAAFLRSHKPRQTDDHTEFVCRVCGMTAGPKAHNGLATGVGALATSGGPGGKACNLGPALRERGRAGQCCPRRRKRGRPTRNRQPRQRQCEMTARVASRHCRSGQRRAGGMSACATAGGRDGRPQGPASSRGSWWMCQTSWGGTYWLSINPKEKKQHVKIWVKRYPKDTGVPVPQECHDWVKTSFVLVQNREPPAKGGDTGGEKPSEAAAASSTGQAGEKQQDDVAAEGSGQAAPTTKDVELGDADFSVDAAMSMTARSQRVVCPPKEARHSPRSGGGLKSASLWGRLGVHPAGVARQPGGDSDATAVIGGQGLVCASVYGPLACTRDLHQS